MINHLNGMYNFKVITRDTDYCETNSYPHIKRNAWNQLNENTEVFYFSNDYLSVSHLVNLIEKTNYDVAYINGIYSFWFSILPLFFIKKKNKKTIVAARGMLSAQAIGIKTIKKKTFLQLAKLAGLYKHVVFHATNKNEAVDIKNATGNHRILIAPNLPKKQKEQQKTIVKNTGELNLCSIARISPEKNTLYALEILQQAKANINFSIYGTIYNKDYWKKCTGIIEKLPENVTATYKGTATPAEVDDILSENHFLFLPTKGENFGHIILESFMNARPVIISNKTPWQNLNEKKCGWDIDLTSKAEFAATIDKCAKMNATEYHSMTTKTINFAKEAINLQQIIQLYKVLMGDTDNKNMQPR